MTQMNLPVVLEFVDDVPNDTAATVCGDCGLEIDRAMSAVRTRKHVIDRSIEWL
jgi:hypothetical protein